ncbi:MAG TPA: hypothetical protein VGD69_26275 [Herpetosiphonaceae bacterium]
MINRYRRPLLIVALIMVSLFTVNFAVRAFHHGRRFRERTDEPIQPWMNVPYISRAYAVPPPVVAAAIGLAPEQRDRRPLQEIAREQGRATQTLIAEIMAAIERERAAHPPGPPGPPAASPPPTPEVQP